MTFEPRCLATGIGSLPHDSLTQALATIQQTIPEVPYPPQLPAISWYEGMLVQYTEGLPGRVLDEARQKLHLDTEEQGPLALEDFYMRVIGDDPAALAISDAYFAGFSALCCSLAGAQGLKAVKTQITGPVTQGLSTVDHNKRAIYYDSTFQEVVRHNCSMKARWMVRRLKEIHPVVLCFLDEPGLSAFGSSVYVSVKREDVIAQLQEVGDAIRAEGGLCGVHCCGNTDWTLLFDAKVDVLSFDAFEYDYTLALYPDAVRSYLLGGGLIAWGVIPTSEAILENNVDSLYQHFFKAIEPIERLGIPRETILRQALITPACGLGSVSIELAERAFSLLQGVSSRLRQEAGA